MNEIHRLQPPAESPIAASIEAEQQVLGMILLDPVGLSPVISAGGESLFADPVHRDIFGAMTAKHRDGHLVSPVTISDVMREHDGLRQVGGGGYLARLAGASMSQAALKGFLHILSDWRRKRDILEAVGAAQHDIAYTDAPADHIAARLESALIASQPAGSDGPVSMMAAVTKAMTQIAAAYEGDQGGAVKTGIDSLDRIVGAFYPGDLVYLGGRPSMGKTALALSIALNVARNGRHVAIASLEMTPDAMAMRAMSEQTAHQKCAVKYSSMRRGDMTDAHIGSLHEAARIVSSLPITFLPRQYNDIGAMSAGVKHIARRGDLGLVVVDYLQLMRSSVRGNTNEQVSDISKSLKALAMQLEVPVLALSQLSRAVEQREDKRPVLSDLRDSGSIEQDADTVMFCYRDEYYLSREEPDADNLDAWEAWRGAMERTRNRLDIIVPKQRAGEIGTARVRCNPALNLVWED
jgi:replicative DNA helicase